VFATVQTYIPKLAAELLPIADMRPRARAAGIEKASLEISTYRAKGRVRFTCKRPVAEFIANELRVAIGRATDERSKDALRQGLDALLAGIATPIDRLRQPSVAGWVASRGEATPIEFAVRPGLKYQPMESELLLKGRSSVVASRPSRIAVARVARQWSSERQPARARVSLLRAPGKSAQLAAAEARANKIV
jgi:hypothetical protein